MEKLVNCKHIMDIEFIEGFSGGNEGLSLNVVLSNKTKKRITFDRIWDFRYCIENAVVYRGTQFGREDDMKSSILIVENSEYIKYFEQQVSGTLPVDKLKEYIIFDKVDTVISALAFEDPEVEDITE